MLVRAIIALLLVSGFCLQYKYWFSDVGHFRDETLGAEVQRNRILAAEVRAQKHGLAAVEARARSDLGMIKEGETFYLVDAESR